LGALRSALAAKLADGNLIVVDSLDLKEAKTKTFREALAGFKFNKTALVVEAGTTPNANLELSTRNIAGVEMLYGPEVHPYHLLRHELAVFSVAALEKLQSTLKASAPKRKAEVENV
jgi:large subunit ribosomal protein L4